MDVRTDVPVDVRTDVGTDVGTDVPGPDAAPGAWRSALFPDDWRPLHAGGRADSMGRYLHDFSFAGYRRGERPPLRHGHRRAHRRRGPRGRATRRHRGDSIRPRRGVRLHRHGPARGRTARGHLPPALPDGDARHRPRPAHRVLPRGAARRWPAIDTGYLDDAVNARSRALLRTVSRSYNVVRRQRGAPHPRHHHPDAHRLRRRRGGLLAGRARRRA